MIKQFLIAGVVIFGLSGCSLAPESYQEPRLTFEHLQEPLQIDVRSTTVENQYKTPLIDGHMEYRFVNDPVVTLTKLIQKRIEPTGNHNFLSFKIEEASMKEKEIGTDDGFFSLFNIQNANEYEGRIVVLMELLDDNSQSIMGHRITVKRRTTIPNDASLIERQKTGFKMLENLMGDFDTKMSELLIQYYQ